MKIALVPWGNVIEDFLDAIGISLDSFCNEMTGGWLFGYIEALKLGNISVVIICVSSTVSQPTRRTHVPTGSTIWLLPVSPFYSAVHRHMVNPYGWTAEETFGKKSSIHRFWLAGLREISPYWATPLRAIARVLKAESCQTILCQEYEYQRFDLCVLLGKLLNIPVYASFQGGNFQTTRFEKLWRRWSIHASAGLIVATKSEIDRVQSQYGLLPSKLAQIFNPLEMKVWEAGDRATTRKELEFGLETQVVVWHGRVDIHRKGLDVLIQAWQQVCHNLPDRDIKLLLVGTGSDAPNFYKQIERMNLSKFLWIDKYVLDRQQICNYLKAADIYVLPSRHEGFPVAPLEAMACGLPVIAAEVEGIPDILVENEDSGGIRVPREDANQLASALERLITDKTLCQALGKKAKDRVKNHFSLTAVGHQVSAFMFPGDIP